jgi:hypothetical protein
MNGGAMTIRLLAVSALLIVITGPAYASEENAISLGSSRRSDIDSVLMSWQLGENIPAVPQAHDIISDTVVNKKCLSIADTDEIIVCAADQSWRFRINKSISGFNNARRQPFTQAAIVAAKCDPTTREGCQNALPISQVVITMVRIGKEILTKGDWRDALVPSNDDAARFQYYLKEKAKDN